MTDTPTPYPTSDGDRYAAVFEPVVADVPADADVSELLHAETLLDAIEGAVKARRSAIREVFTERVEQVRKMTGTAPTLRDSTYGLVLVTDPKPKVRVTDRDRFAEWAHGPGADTAGDLVEKRTTVVIAGPDPLALLDDVHDFLDRDAADLRFTDAEALLRAVLDAAETDTRWLLSEQTEDVLAERLRPVGDLPHGGESDAVDDDGTKVPGVRFTRGRSTLQVRADKSARSEARARLDAALAALRR